MCQLEGVMKRFTGARLEKSKITILSVAQAAGVSVGTVSNVFSGRKTVNPEIRNRVQLAAQDLHYSPDRVAASLRSRRSRTIGLCIPDLGNPFFGDLLRQLNRVLENDGYRLLAVETREDGALEPEKLAVLCANRVEGIFMVPTATWAGTPTDDIPVIVIDRVREDEPLPSVCLDNAGAIDAALAHLHALGHRSIWMVVNSTRLWNSQLRVSAFLAAADRLGMADRVEVLQSGMAPQDMAIALADHLQGTAPPTAILTASGTATLGTLRALQDCGLSVPDDISVLGFDDVVWMEVLRPSISVVRQPITAMAAQAWMMMQTLMVDGALTERHVRLPATLVQRDSTCRVIAEPVILINERKVAHV